ncbi:MAG: AAA family ATPase [Myxococcota bacterium]|nr:AAA family ATPase [Myxococcota bacterium]
MPVFGKVELNFGSEPGGESLSFQPGVLTLVVGPNNSGKSLFLRELAGVNPRAGSHLLRDTRWLDELRVVADVEWSPLVAEDIRKEILSEQEHSRIRLFGDWTETGAFLDWAGSELLAAWSPVVETLLRMRGGPNAALINYVIPEPLGLPLAENWAKVVVLAFYVLSHQDEEFVVTEFRQELFERVSIAWEGSLEVAEKAGLELEKDDLKHLCTSKVLVRFFSSHIAALGIAAFFAELGKKMGKPVPAVGPNPAGFIERMEALAALSDDWRKLVEQPLEMVRVEEKYRWLRWRKNGGIESKLVVRYLDGGNRLELTTTQSLQAYSAKANVLSRLLYDTSRRELLRRLVWETLGEHLYIDAVSEPSRATWVLSKEETSFEGRHSHEALEFFSNTLPLASRSDGVHAYVGLLAEVVAAPQNVIFIDEPEAFLHPPLARTLVRQLCEVARQHDKQLFVSTHSQEVLTAAVRSGVELSILRLTYDGTHGTARTLPPRVLAKVAVDPLLRSERTLSALFHTGAIVCEADADRVFYEQINEVLLREQEGGLDSLVFMNAQNWSTVRRMVGPLRKMGVPAAAIIDLDCLFEKEMKQLFQAARVPRGTQDGWNQTRQELKKSSSGRLKSSNLSELSREQHQSLEGLLESMARYGVFVVPVGELEDWYGPEVVGNRQKTPWVQNVLGRLSEDYEGQDRLGFDDSPIWDFMRRVTAWIENPRWGID